MQFTRSGKILATVLGLGLVALLVDRLNPPRGAEAAIAAGGGAEALAAASTGGAEPPAIPRTTLTARFEKMSARYGLEPASVRDLLKAPEAWFPEPTATGAPTAAETPARRFLRRHRLNAVMADGARGYAILDGRRLRIGEVLDGFTLSAVGERSVTLEGAGTFVELTLSEPAAPTDGG